LKIKQKFFQIRSCRRIGKSSVKRNPQLFSEKRLLFGKRADGIGIYVYNRFFFLRSDKKRSRSLRRRRAELLIEISGFPIPSS